MCTQFIKRFKEIFTNILNRVMWNADGNVSKIKSLIHQEPFSYLCAWFLNFWWTAELFLGILLFSLHIIYCWTSLMYYKYKWFHKTSNILKIIFQLSNRTNCWPLKSVQKVLCCLIFSFIFSVFDFVCMCVRVCTKFYTTCKILFYVWNINLYK